jgi:hypothetical protein
MATVQVLRMTEPVPTRCYNLSGITSLLLQSERVRQKHENREDGQCDSLYDRPPRA